RQHLVSRALQLMQADFQPGTWKACWEQVANGRAAAEVARELGMTVNAAHLAKSRVLRRLRQGLGGLLGWEKKGNHETHQPHEKRTQDRRDYQEPGTPFVLWFSFRVFRGFSLFPDNFHPDGA